MEKEVEIADMWLAAFLLAKKHHMVSHNVAPSGFVSFVFSDKEGAIEADIQAHISGQSQINSSEFVTAFRNLRSVIVRAKTENRK